MLAEIRRREKEGGRERVRDGTTKRRDRERTTDTATKKHESRPRRSNQGEKICYMLHATCGHDSLPLSVQYFAPSANFALVTLTGLSLIRSDYLPRLFTFVKGVCDAR